MAWLRSDRSILVVGWIAFLAFLGRAILDWRYVYDEFIGRDDAPTTLLTLAFYLAFAGAWVWALISTAGGSRSGPAALLVYSLVFLVAVGVATPLAFCPMPCDGWKRWPFLEATNWLGLAIGVVAVGVSGGRLRAFRT